MIFCVTAWLKSKWEKKYEKKKKKIFLCGCDRDIAEEAMEMATARGVDENAEVGFYFGGHNLKMAWKKVNNSHFPLSFYSPPPFLPSSSSPSRNALFQHYCFILLVFFGE